MRILTLILCLLVYPGVVFGQEITLEPVVHTIEFEAPAGWAVNEISEHHIFLSTTVETGWIPDVPPSPHAWFVILRIKKEENPCEARDEKLRQFARPRDKRPIHVASGCKFGFMVIGGYWDEDPERDKRALDVLEMYTSLRRGQ